MISGRSLLGSNTGAFIGTVCPCLSYKASPIGWKLAPVSPARSSSLKCIGLLSERPPLAIFGAEEFIGLVAVGEAHLRSVPEEFFHGEFFAHFGVESDITEEDDFSERPGPIEIRAAGFAAFAGFNPFF